MYYDVRNSYTTSKRCDLVLGYLLFVIYNDELFHYTNSIIKEDFFFSVS